MTAAAILGGGLPQLGVSVAVAMGGGGGRRCFQRAHTNIAGKEGERVAFTTTAGQPSQHPPAHTSLFVGLSLLLLL
jgi:hypothetical protein